jgi:hypothetical protein
MPWPFEPADPNQAANADDQSGWGGMFSPGSLLSNPDFRRHAAYDALTNAGLGLIAASAPSPVPQNFGTMFGSLAAGAATGVQNSADRYMKLGTQGAQMRMLSAQAQAYPEAIRLMRSAAGGGGYNPYGSAQPPQQATPPQSAPPAGAAPGGAGINDNNIGNVEAPPGSPTRFQQSPDFNSGVSLLVKNAQAYPAAFNGGKPMDLMQIAERWAPAKDGNDPKAWAFNVSRFSGLPADKPLNLSDPIIAASFARGVHGPEKGAKAIKPTGDYMPGVQLARAGPGPRAMPPQGNGGPPMTGDPQAAQPPVQLAQAGPQPGMPQQPGQGMPPPMQLPPMPTNAPNPAKYMGLTMMGGPFAKSAEMLSKGEQAQFDAAMKIYNAQLAGTKAQREQAVSPVNPDGSINQSVVAAAAAKTDAEKHYAESTAPYKEPDIKEFVSTLPKQTQAAFNSAVGRGDTKEAGELLDKATGGIPIELLKLRGPALMEKLPPAEQSILSGLLDGSISIQDLPQRSAAAGSRMDLLALAKRVDKDFSTTNGPSRKAFEENLSHGQGLQMLSSLNVAPQHMLQYRKLMQANQNGNTQAFNEVRNYIAEHLGHPEITSAKAMQEFLATEVARAVHGAGALGESTVESALSKIGTQQSDAQNIGVLNEWAKALSARTNFLQYQARERHHIPEKTWRTYVMPEAQGALDELGRQASAPPAPTPGPAQSQARPQQSQFPQPKTPAEAMAYPSGTVFRTPEGKIKVRP